MSISWKTNRPGGLTLTQRALDICGFTPGAVILDAGCGFGATGRFLRQSRNFTVIGLDADSIRLAKAGEVISTTCARLPGLPFRANTFHGIFCECVLSLVQDKARCLAEFNRVLKPDGTLVLTDLFLPGSREGRVSRAACGTATCIDGALTLLEWEKSVGLAGFEINILEDHTRLLKQMACEMVFEHGSLDRFWADLTGGDMPRGLTGLCRTGCLKPGYCMVIAKRKRI